MKVLVTGAAGFAGSHLLELLLREGDQVAGTVMPGENPANIVHLGEQVRLFSAEITEPAAVKATLAAWRPEVIYHLAGISSVGQSWGRMETTLKVNALGLLNLAQAGLEFGRPPILVVGSAEMYGRVAEERQPITEAEPLSPVNPYALSKVWQEEGARYLHAVHGYPVLLVRSFNHTGPRQSPFFVCSDFARQVALIEAGRVEPVIRVGNLEARRDFLDVRDVVAAYHRVVESGRPGVPYNIASGHPHAVHEVLDILTGLARVPVRVESEAARMRPVDIPLLTGDASRLRRETGWAPARALTATLEDLLDHWRAALAGRKDVT